MSYLEVVVSYEEVDISGFEVRVIGVDFDKVECGMVGCYIGDFEVGCGMVVS